MGSVGEGSDEFEKDRANANNPPGFWDLFGDDREDETVLVDAVNWC